MQIEKEYALVEWEQRNPPPQLRRANRDGLRVAGAIGAMAMSYAGVGGSEWVRVGTQYGAAALEQKDATILRQQQAQRERNKTVYQEQLAVHADQTGSALDFFQSKEQRSATLDELGKLIKPYQGKQIHSTWSREIANLRSRNNQNEVVTSQIVDLKRQIEDHVAEQETVRQANEAKLAELEEWITEHQNQSQTYRNLMSRISNLRTSNNRGTDVASQMATLEKDIERFIEAPNQPTQQQRQPTQQRRGLLR